MKTLIVLILGAAIGVAAYMYIREPENRPALERAGERISEGAGQIGTNLGEKFADFDTEKIKEELARTGRVVRKKAEQAGAAIADAAADAKITAQVKSKFATDTDLSVLQISVNTTDGIVTLAGSVSSPEHIKKAMQLALQVEGAKEVVSTLQVKASK